MYSVLIAIELRDLHLAIPAMILTMNLSKFAALDKYIKKQTNKGGDSRMIIDRSCRSEAIRPSNVWMGDRRATVTFVLVAHVLDLIFPYFTLSGKNLHEINSKHIYLSEINTSKSWIWLGNAWLKISSLNFSATYTAIFGTLVIQSFIISG